MLLGLIAVVVVPSQLARGIVTVLLVVLLGTVGLILGNFSPVAGWGDSDLALGGLVVGGLIPIGLFLLGNALMHHNPKRKRE